MGRARALRAGRHNAGVGSEVWEPTAPSSALRSIPRPRRSPGSGSLSPCSATPAPQLQTVLRTSPRPVHLDAARPPCLPAPLTILTTASCLSLLFFPTCPLIVVLLTANATLFLSQLYPQLSLGSTSSLKRLITVETHMLPKTPFKHFHLDHLKA